MSEAFAAKASAWVLAKKFASQTKRPLAATVEIADRCNEKCVHCYQVQGQKGEMTTEDIFGLLDTFAEQGILFLTISGGEATLRSDFLEIVRYARVKRFAVKIYTNGLRVNKAMAEELASLAVQEVQISLYSPRPHVHDEVTRVKGSFEKTTQAARWLVAAGVGVLLKTPLMKFNEGDHDAYIALCEDIGADYAFDASLLAREDGDTTPLQLGQSTSATLDVISDTRVGPAVSHVPAKPLSRSVCGAAISSIHVEANGELRACPALSVDLGNFLEGGLEESNQEAEFIASLTWGDLHGCRHCDLRPYCSRCFETARSEGDAMGPYRMACTQARNQYARHVGPVDFSDELGPYEVKGSTLQQRTYELSASDLRLREEHPWIRERAKDMAPTKDLVQIRRSEGGALLKETVDQSRSVSSVSQTRKTT